MRDRDVLQLGIRAAQMALRGDDYAGVLAEEIHRIFHAQVGITMWSLDAPTGARIAAGGVADITAAEHADMVRWAPLHPQLQPCALTDTEPYRFSDRMDLERFWDTDIWWHMHGIRGGRYPLAMSLGIHDGEAGIIGIHRQSRDFDTRDVDDLSLLQEPLRSALQFQASLRKACRRIDRVVDRLPSRSAEQSPALTSRETEVLALVATGRTNPVIGSLLGITERTVRKHLGSVHSKLGVSSRTAAAVWYREHAR